VRFKLRNGFRDTLTFLSCVKVLGRQDEAVSLGGPLAGGIGPEEFISIADRYMATARFRRRIGRDRRGAVCILAGRPPHDGV
jgi:hypothetical protein